VPTYRKLEPLMANIEADYLVANFRGEEFDLAYAQVSDLVDLGEMQPAEAAPEIQRLCQEVLDKEPA
jgi:hypothetical protein